MSTKEWYIILTIFITRVKLIKNGEIYEKD